MFLYFFDEYVGVELLDRGADPFLIFWEPSILLSIVARPVYLPPAVCESSFSTFSLTPIHYLFDMGCSDRLKVVGSSLWFWFDFPWQVKMSIFPSACGYLCVFIGEVQFSFPTHSFHWLIYFLGVELLPSFSPRRGAPDLKPLLSLTRLSDSQRPCSNSCPRQSPHRRLSSKEATSFSPWGRWLGLQSWSQAPAALF